MHANPAWRALVPELARYVPCPEDAGMGILNAPPRLDYETFDIQAATLRRLLIQRSYSIEDTFSWFVPNKGPPRSEVRRALLAHLAEQSELEQHERHLPVRKLSGSAVQPAIRDGTRAPTIRVPGPLTYEMVMHVYEIFAQNKWQTRPGMTVSVGLRYDLEMMPIKEDPGNPLFTDPSKYPVDKDNISPRLGFVRNPDGEGSGASRGTGSSTTRRCWEPSTTSLPTRKDAFFEANFPAVGPDLGPRNGQLPTEKGVLLTPRVDQLSPAVRALINVAYPPVRRVRNTGTVTWDDPERSSLWDFHQVQRRLRA